jgi:hypothetical protein
VLGDGGGLEESGQTRSKQPVEQVQVLRTRRPGARAEGLVEATDLLERPAPYREVGAGPEVAVEARMQHLPLGPGRHCDGSLGGSLMLWHHHPAGHESGPRVREARNKGIGPAAAHPDVVVDEPDDLVLGCSPPCVAGPAGAGALAAQRRRTDAVGELGDRCGIGRGGVDDEQLVPITEIGGERFEAARQQSDPVSGRDDDGQRRPATHGTTRRRVTRS